MDQREKRYVPVIVRFDAEGKLRPLEIEFDESHKYPVDKILDVCRAACQSVGGVGDRYTCLIQGKETYLWMEKGDGSSVPNDDSYEKMRRRQCWRRLCLTLAVLFYIHSG